MKKLNRKPKDVQALAARRGSALPKRIKDLPPTQSLGGVRFRYPSDGQLYYWSSQWQKGVWGRKRMEDSQMFPLFCDDLKDAMEWELAPAPNGGDMR